MAAQLPASRPHYADVKSLHADFHRCTAGVLEPALGGQTRQAEEAVGFNGEYRKISAALTRAMMSWKSAAN